MKVVVDGQVMEMPAQDAAAMALSGRGQLEPGTQVPVRSTDGKVGVIPAERLADLVAEGNYQPTSQEDLAAAEREAEMGSDANAALALAAGFGRTASLGGTDVVAVLAGGDDARRTLRDLKEENPIANTVGGIGGAVVPALAARNPGGIGKVASFTPAGAISRLGMGVEQGVSRIVGTGATSLAGRVAQRALPMAASGAVEGAIFGAASQFSEDFLGGHDITAQRLLAGNGDSTGGALRGMIYGAGFGGGLGVIAGAGSYGIAKAGARTRSLIGGAGREVVEEGGEAGMALRAVNFVRGKNYRNWDEALKDYASDTAVRATGATNKMVRRYQDYQKFQPEVAERIDDALAGRLSPRGGAPTSYAEVADDVAALVAKAKNEIDALVPAIDDTAKAKGFKMNLIGEGGVLPRLRSLADEYRGTLGGKPFAKQVDDMADHLEGLTFKTVERMLPDGTIATMRIPKMTPTLETMREWRSFIDKAKAGYGKGESTAQKEVFRGIRKILEDANEEYIERVAQVAGGDFATAYKNWKLDYQAVQWLAKASESGLAREGANRTLGLSEHLSSIGGMIAAGPVGGLLMPVAANIAKHRGGFFMAEGARRLRRAMTPREEAIGALAKTSSAVEARTDRAVGAFVKRMLNPSGARSAIPRAYVVATEPEAVDTQKRAQQIAASVRELQANPRAMLTKIEQAAGPLAQHAPGTYGAIARTMSRGVEHLAANLPPPVSTPHLLGHLDKENIPADLADKLVRIADAVNNPLFTLDRMARGGDVSVEEIDAIRAVYPDLFGQVQQKIMAGLASGDVNPTYSERITLGITFGVPADESLHPLAIKMQQAIYQHGPPGGPPGGGAPPPQQGPKVPLETASRMRTPDQIREAGGRF